MNQSNLTVGKASEILGVSIQTLRRWDEDGTLPARRNQLGSNRTYQYADLTSAFDKGLVRIEKMAYSWAQAREPWMPPEPLYCHTSAVFQTRLRALEQELATIPSIQKLLPLLTAVAGEIGNNSFDHNLGNWPDVLGIFFGFDKKRQKIVLADRGQGILTTLKRVKPDLTTHKAAIEMAFTCIISGRSPENRGNGLKFVRKIIENNPFALVFQTGDAVIQINQRIKKIHPMLTDKPIKGCIAIISF